MGRASKILADGFFKENTNFFTYQFERLETYLSLESGFPKPQTLHQIFVACDAISGVVLGVAEVDARTTDDDPRSSTKARGQNGPYMCNVAVDPKYQRMGIASALVRQCELQVNEWVRDHPELSHSLHLKVRAQNEAAIRMYEKLGYQSIRQETEERTNMTVLVMRKDLSQYYHHQHHHQHHCDTTIQPTTTTSKAHEEMPLSSSSRMASISM